MTAPGDMWSADHSGDFTLARYRELLQLAHQRYVFSGYADIPWGTRFVLWRHDVDLSLNRALKLARLEREEGVRATYFLNPHSTFYNVAEQDQHRLVQEIMALGHDIGLHLDVAFHGIESHEQLENAVVEEAGYLHRLFDRPLTAFSFHDPLPAHLELSNERYGGLVNCYSRRLREDAGYCSDSNGYWRFQPLADVLRDGHHEQLQVLTHPGWWQDVPMPPRQRVFRAAYGRASATLNQYDAALVRHDRSNRVGPSMALEAVRPISPSRGPLFDYLWNSGYTDTLLLELWRLHEEQVRRWCERAAHSAATPVPEEAHAQAPSSRGVWGMFEDRFGPGSWAEATGVPSATYAEWCELVNIVWHGHASLSARLLEDACVGLCQLIAALADWANTTALHRRETQQETPGDSDIRQG